MKKFIPILGLIIVTIAAPFVTAQRSKRPVMPFIDKGACPFECCTYRRWNVERPTVVRSSMSDSSPIAFRLKRGERVQGMTGVVITTKPGILRVLKDTTLSEKALKVGDEIFILTYLGEGFSKIWFKGSIFEGDPYDPAVYKVVQEADATWWVKVRNRAGKVGWSRQPDNFGNKDQCG
jgi:hypothetical protein